MCGIAGFLATDPSSPADELRHIATQMAVAMWHRGPDDGGAWADEQCGVAFGMRRLAILDLSPAGHQPMHSRSGRYILLFNGEIYNCEDLRKDLLSEDPSLRFRGHSDTEVMLAAFERWGVAESVKRFNGMFAFALWDREHRTLTLARDRFGEKPLYYCVSQGHFLFGSELKALRAHPRFAAEVDRGAMALYLRHNCIPAPYSIYTNTRKLPPASLLTVSAGNFDAVPQPYWSMRTVAEAGVANPLQCSEQDAIEMLDTLLRDAVKIRMYSDVPLGASLSGGVDSSLVVAMMQAQSSLPVRTFTVGSGNPEFDESTEAARVARHLHTDHTEWMTTPEDAAEIIPRLPQMYDEPFADSSQIPTYLVARLARQKVTVALSGDGGDEMFGGYNRHTWCETMWSRLSPLPRPIRNLSAYALMMVSPDTWDHLFRASAQVLPRKLRLRMPGYKMHKLALAMGRRDPYEMYYGFVSHWDRPESVVKDAIEPPTAITQNDRPQFGTVAEGLMFLDSITYLPDDILVKVDRATMDVALEGRIPYLDHRVAEFAWRLPLAMRVRGQEGKWILRQLLYRYVPREMVDRPKSGFGFALDAWLRGGLRDWAEGLLAEDRIRSEGFFQPEPIRQRWKEHLSGQRNWAYLLWDILMFQAWLEDSRRSPVADPRISAYEVQARETA